MASAPSSPHSVGATKKAKGRGSASKPKPKPAKLERGDVALQEVDGDVLNALTTLASATGVAFPRSKLSVKLWVSRYERLQKHLTNFLSGPKPSKLPLNEKWSEKHLCNAMLQLEASLDREALVWQSTKDRQDWLGRLRKYVNECPNETNPKDDQKIPGFCDLVPYRATRCKYPQYVVIESSSRLTKKYVDLFRNYVVNSSCKIKRVPRLTPSGTPDRRKAYIQNLRDALHYALSQPSLTRPAFHLIADLPVVAFNAKTRFFEWQTQRRKSNTIPNEIITSRPGLQKALQMNTKLTDEIRSQRLNVECSVYFISIWWREREWIYVGKAEKKCHVRQLEHLTQHKQLIDVLLHSTQLVEKDSPLVLVTIIRSCTSAEKLRQAEAEEIKSWLSQIDDDGLQCNLCNYDIPSPDKVKPTDAEIDNADVELPAENDNGEVLLDDETTSTDDFQSLDELSNDSTTTSNSISASQ